MAEMRAYRYAPEGGSSLLGHPGPTESALRPASYKKGYVDSRSPSDWGLSVLSDIALQLHARIDIQDANIALAVLAEAHPKLIQRMQAVAMDLRRAWGAQIQRDQFAAAGKVIA